MSEPLGRGIVADGCFSTKVYTSNPPNTEGSGVSGSSGFGPEDEVEVGVGVAVGGGDEGGDQVGDEMGDEVVGSELGSVVGEEVGGEEMVGEEVVGEEMVGQEVVGEEDVDARQEVGEVSEEKCGRPIGCSTPIEVGIARRRTGARMGGRGKKKGVGVGGRKWTREERKWLYECMCWVGKRRGFLWEVSKLFHARGYNRSDPSLRAQIGVIEGGGLTKMEMESIEEEVRIKQEEWGVFDGVWERTFHGFWCDCCKSILRTEVEEVDSGKEDDRESEDGGEYQEVDYQLYGVNPRDKLLIVGNVEGADRPEREVGACEVRSGEEGGGRFMVDGVEVKLIPAEVVVEVVDTWKETDGSVRALTEDERAALEILRRVRDDGEWKDVPNMRTVPRKKLMKEVELIDGLMHNVVQEGMGVAEVNRLLYAAGMVAAERLGLKTEKSKKAEQKKPFWQRRIEESIKKWRKDLSQVEEIRKGSKVGEKLREVLERRYSLTERGAASVSTFLKGKIEAGSTKIRWFVERKVARRQNSLFQNNQRQVYKELGGGTNGNTNEVPDATESKKFWEGIWSVETEHVKDATWLGEARRRMEHVGPMEEVEIKKEDVLHVIRRMANWKAPGPDGVRGFWFKRITSLHVHVTEALKQCVMSGEVPEWMTKGRTVFIQKDPAKGRAVSNYRPIACLPLMWKLLTGIFAEKIYDHLHTNNALPDEQKGCRKRSRGTKDQLLIDKAVLKEARLKKRCLAMAWIDYRKAYDMVPHSWILETLGLIKVAKNIEGLLRGSMKSWKTVLTANGEELGEVSIRRGIFQGDSLSPLLFVVAMIPLTSLLRREEMGYRFGKEGKKINHLLFMDDLKLYGRSAEEVDKLCGVVHKFSEDIGMKFGMDKCAVLEMKNGVKVKSKGVELPDGEVMKEVEEEGYKYLGVLESDDILMDEMKEKVRREYFRRVKAAAGSQLYAGRLLQAVNTWAVSVVRYTAGILKWNEKELQKMDTRTRKILSMNGAFHTRSSVDRLYIKRKEGGRGLMSVEECVRAEEAGLDEYVLASEEWMLKVVAEGVGENEEVQSVYKKRVDSERKVRLGQKLIHGKFFKDVEKVADPRSWQWLSGGYLDKKKESYICAAQENVLNTRLYGVTKLGQEGDGKCRKCGIDSESVGHLVSACSKLCQREYRKRHDRVGLRVYWELCGRYGLKRSETWYDEVPDPVRVSANGRFEIRWDQKIHTPRAIKHNRPDVVVIDREEKKWTMIDFAVCFDANVERKEVEKMEVYNELATLVRGAHKVKVDIVPIVVGTLGVVSKGLEGWLKKLEVGDIIGGLQTTALICTAAILKKVLNT